MMIHKFTNLLEIRRGPQPTCMAWIPRNRSPDFTDNGLIRPYSNGSNFENEMGLTVGVAWTPKRATAQAFDGERALTSPAARRVDADAEAGPAPATADALVARCNPAGLADITL